MMEETDFEVIIIGGSYAGLSAAMALGRSLRRVLIIDSGLPCNRQTPHSHNFLTQDGETPHAIALKARSQVAVYETVKFIGDVAISGQKMQSEFKITTKSSGIFKSKKLLFATGIKDIAPDIPGFTECWGISVVHCPYCHGYELRNQVTGIMANGEKAFHLASLVNNLTNNITILTSGKSAFTPEQNLRLERNKIKIVEQVVREIEHEAGQVRGVVLENGEKLDFRSIYASVPFSQHSDIPSSLGCELTENGYIKVDASQKTTVEGVYACGDNSNMMRSVANAIFTGNLAGAMINREMTEQSF